MKQSLFLVLGALVIAGLVYLNLSERIEPYTPTVELPHKATSASIAIPNHNSSLEETWKQIESGEIKSIHLGRVYGMAMTSGRLLGNTGIYDRLDKSITAALAKEPNNAQLLRLQARFQLATHQFANANRQYLSPEDQITLDWALSGHTSDLIAQRDEAATLNPSTINYVMLADALIQGKRYADADAAYEKALAAYRDVSPFTLSWIYFLRGVLHGEKVAEPNLELAQKYYEYAVAYVPDYAQARVHLSEVYAENGDLKLAIGSLLPVADSLEPEVQGRLAGYYRDLGDEEMASQYRTVAHERYAELLEIYPLAFADHAAEFYSDAGEDQGRAFELARMHYRNIPSEDSFSTLIEMARPLNKVTEVCQETANTRRYGSQAAAVCTTL